MRSAAYVRTHGLDIDSQLFDFVEQEALPGSGIASDTLWSGLAGVVERFSARHEDLLAVRRVLQESIDDWHDARRGMAHDAAEYRAFLQSIGYLVPAGEQFAIDTTGLDAEIAVVAGPQLVVPATNARYALNAANARWGSLYDALYGTDALGDPPAAGPYDPIRGGRVIAWVRAFLDDAVPLETGSHARVSQYRVEHGALVAKSTDGATTQLRCPDVFVAFNGTAGSPSSLLLEHHGLGIEIVIDRAHPVGRSDGAGVADVLLEAALTTIIDLEDSVATVDGRDKASAYRNWLGLMKGDLTESVTKAGSTFVRRLADHRHYEGRDGTPVARRGRALMLIRNVGHLMTTPAVLNANGDEVPEGIVDAMFSVLAGLHDRLRPEAERNSPAGSIYIVKPKMHGPDEVALANDIVEGVESVLGLPHNTVKLGIMDEERRLTLNLAESIRAARSRVVFINTGFLDRTGDEIHTSMMAGPMVRKGEMRGQRWFQAYEDRNVDIALACGFGGRAQIGKGMWAAPDQMRDLLAQKITHPLSGADCAWVPSPTAATLHATHYHRVDVDSQQASLAGRVRASIDDLLAIPVAQSPSWTAEERRAEVDNNVQGILGYVVRWVDHGIGCSKVPDIGGVGLMEDRATCRISSQHVANWLLHGVVTRDDVMDSLRRMAAVVDVQNSTDPQYVAMAPSFDGQAFRAATELVLGGRSQPSGYTEPILHAHRRAQKLAAHRRE